ncbi:hypothetical protein JYK21_06020 [Ralstonia pickettii]|nr:hypothetical protein [Ralstonia pickettii]
MGNFIEFIMNNMFLVIIIISGIIGFLSSNKEEQKKQQQRKTQQQRPAASKTKPTPTPSGPQEPQHRQRVYQTKTQSEEKDLTTTASIADEQQEQMKRLEERYGITSTDLTDEDLSLQGLKFQKSLSKIKDLSEEQRVLKKDIRKSLKNKGLINGIIMAEVLGKPRSLKPYESVTLERYKK